MYCQTQAGPTVALTDKTHEHEGSLSQEKMKLLVQSCRDQWQGNTLEDLDCLGVQGIQCQVWSRSNSSYSDPHTLEISSSQKENTPSS